MASLVKALPRELFRLIFEYLFLSDLREVDNAFMGRELRPLYLSQLCGMIWKEELALTEELSSWCLLRNILVAQPFFQNFSHASIPLLSNSQSVLTEIRLMNHSTSQFFPFFGCYPNVSLLWTNSCGLTDGMCENFLSMNSQLTCLNICDESELSTAAIASITTHCWGLEELKVLDNHWFTDESLLQLIRGCPRLEYLDISSTGVTQIESVQALLDTHRSLHTLLCINLPLEIEKLCLRQVLLPSVMSSDGYRRSGAMGSMMLVVETVCPRS
jgi:hypothetical protein